MKTFSLLMVTLIITPAFARNALETNKTFDTFKYTSQGRCEEGTFKYTNVDLQVPYKNGLITLELYLKANGVARFYIEQSEDSEIIQSTWRDFQWVSTNQTLVIKGLGTVSSNKDFSMMTLNTNAQALIKRFELGNKPLESVTDLSTSGFLSNKKFDLEDEENCSGLLDVLSIDNLDQ